jgi:hypothetical protein
MTVVYDILFRAGGRDGADHRRRSQASRCHDRNDPGVADLGSSTSSIARIPLRRSGRPRPCWTHSDMALLAEKCGEFVRVDPQLRDAP